MRRVSVRLGLFVLAVAVGWIPSAFADNQTATLSPILPGSAVPFSIQIQQAAFQLPSGLQSYAVGTNDGKWLLLTGRINGLHGFGNSNSNFPPNTQNTTVFVVDPYLGAVATRSLTDPTSGLTQAQVDLLSVTAAQSCQSGHTLYIAGGYGIDTASGTLGTKDAFTAIDVPGLIHWVIDPSVGETAAQHIRQTFDPVVQITGGFMVEVTHHHMLLGFGQNFTGGSITSDGTYSEQIRRFRVVDHGAKLAVAARKPFPKVPDPNYRRAGLNVAPIIKNGGRGFVAFSGLFTPTDGVWTVPVEISRTGIPKMADPTAPTTFKQGMNNYLAPTVGFYSRKERNSYTVLMGGISYGFFSGGVFQTDPELPFVNQVTTIKRDRHGIFSQYLMDAEYPVIASTGSNPGNPLLFGTSATFIPVDGLPTYPNGVIKLDALGINPRVIGFIIGGIQSTLPNTNTQADSAASPYVFTVTVVPTPPLS
jgi:hypothetical protein